MSASGDDMVKMWQLRPQRLRGCGGDDPVLAREYFAPVPASDHNLYVVGDRVYQSNYGSGLRVLDISDRENPREIAFFDSAPYNDDGPGFSATESGAWMVS